MPNFAWWKNYNMSIKQHVVYRYETLLDYVGALALPAWLFDIRTKVVLVALVPALALGYLIQINNVSTSGYVIHTLEKEVSVMSRETVNLQTQVAEQQSMVSIQKRLPELSMTKAEKMRFLSPAQPTPVAKR